MFLINGKSAVITILEADVKEELWEKLAQAYDAKTTEVPEYVLQSYLAQSQSDPTSWRIVTAWRSQEDLDAMRQSGETPTGVLIFQEASATPTLSVFTVAKTIR